MNAFRARTDGFAPCLAAMLVCFLVWTQFSGLHLHQPEGERPHVHAAHAPGHGHDTHPHPMDGELDLSLVSLVKQILSFPLALIALCLLLRVSICRRMPLPADLRLSAGPWFRFIPPLRGPPATV